MPDLNNAIELIRQGRREEGRRILETLIKADPKNITAWFWYVETCPTVERRIQVLEVCLKANPGNPQAAQALQALKSIQPAQPSFTPPPAPPKPATPQTPKPASSYSSAYNEKSQPDYFDDTPVYSPTATSTVQQPSPVSQKKPWEQDESAYVDTSMLSKPKPAAQSYTFYDVWMTVMLGQDIESYAKVLDDPEAGLARAFEWTAYAGIVNALIFPLIILTNSQFSELTTMPEFQKAFGGVSMTMFAVILTIIMIVFIPIVSIIGLAINGAIQNILAVTFGGNGYYSRTVYALAAYTAPMTIVSSLLYFIPIVGQCLGSLLGFYGVYLNVRALRAAHSISVGSAIGVILAPGILVFIFACLIIFLFGGMAGSSGS